MDRKWFVSNILYLLLWSNICGLLLVSSYKIPGYLEDNIINDGNFLTNDLSQGNENDGGAIINGVLNDDKTGDYDSEERNGDDKLIRSHENELPLEPKSRGRKRCNVLLLEHLSNLTEIDRGPKNQTIREIFINSEDKIKLFDEDEEEEEEEYEEDDYETGFETSLQKAEPRSIFHLNLLNPSNFLSEKESKELVRTKRQAQGGGRRRRCRCRGRRRGRRRRRRRMRGRTQAQRRRRGGRRRRRRGGRRRCVCRGRGAGGGGGGGGEGGGENGGGEGEAEAGGEEEASGEEAEEGGGEEAEEGGEEEEAGGEEEGGEEAEGSPEVSGEDEKSDQKSDEESDEKSEESNQSSDESDQKSGD